MTAKKQAKQQQLNRRHLLMAGGATGLAAPALIGAPANAMPLTQEPKVEKGEIIYLPMFDAKAVTARDVVIWLPPEEMRTGPLPVIYVNDGEAIFDANASPYGTSWEMDLILHMLAHQGVGPVMVVGIAADAERRSREYNLPTVAAYFDDVLGDLLNRSCGGENLTGDYFDFIINELKPYVDANFDTLPDRDNTYMIGASMGGMLPLEAQLSHADVFAGGIGMSAHLVLFGPGLQFSDYPADAGARVEAALREALVAHLPAPNGNRLYFQRGTVDLDALYGGSHTATAEALLRKGYNFGQDFKMVIDKGASHYDTFWKLRLPEALRFMINGA
ncbi:alpha/beta hydrolase-fold protein [Yoonia sp. BS5-3]|uniref:Acyl-CoA:diacylglycerol acyltransferase n=1 Tax=Yoonia phaeophyticola TaxID=3137369 RepID=A0ABZ2V987_9RHOB